MDDKLEKLYAQFFAKTGIPDNGDNRREMRLGIKELHGNIWSLANMLLVFEEYSDAFMKQQKKRAIYCQPEQSRVILAQIHAENTWFDNKSEENLKTLFDWCYENQAEFTLENIRGAVSILGKSALDHVQVPATPPPQPVVIAAPRFDWMSLIGLADVPLTGPDGSEPPRWFLEKLSRDQIKSYCRRQQAASKPVVQLRPDQLPLDATQEQMQAASPAQLADLIRRQQRVSYSR